MQIKDVYEGVGRGAPARATHTAPQKTRAPRSADIDIQPIDGKAAYEQFGGKEFRRMNYDKFCPLNTYLQNRADAHDFSRDVTSHVGEDAKSAGTKPLETPIQQISRLQGEVSEMKEVVEHYVATHFQAGIDDPAVKAEVIEEAKALFGAPPDVLLNELNLLKAHLDHSFQQHGEAAQRTSTGSREVTYDLVSSEVEQFLKSSKGDVGGDKSRAPQPSEQPFSLEIFPAPSFPLFKETSRLVDLEARIADLEKLLGVDTRKDLELPFADLSEMLQEILRRLFLIDPTQIENLQRRIETVSNDMDQLKRREKALVGVNSDEDDRIDRLYQLCNRWRRSAAVLPTVLERLKSLNALHLEAGSAVARLKSVEQQQEDLLKSLSANEEKLQLMQTEVHSALTEANQRLGEISGFKK